MVGRTRTSDGQVTSYTYDFRNRLTEVLIKTSTGATVQDDKFTYDVENRRIGKNTLSGGQSWTGYDGVNAYADFNTSGSLTYRYLFANAIDFLLARVDTSGNAMWYLTDKLGSVRENVNPSGSVLDSITYDSYGNILSESSPSNGDRFKFTGREWDSEIGQYYYRARYYGPNIGRFESEDPLGFTAGDANFYRYVKNRANYQTDPSGLLAQVVEGALTYLCLGLLADIQADQARMFQLVQLANRLEAQIAQANAPPYSPLAFQYQVVAYQIEVLAKDLVFDMTFFRQVCVPLGFAQPPVIPAAGIAQIRHHAGHVPHFEPPLVVPPHPDDIIPPKPGSEPPGYHRPHPNDPGSIVNT
jgi:RHS repeat-associated protein